MYQEFFTNESILIYGGLILTLVIIFSETAFPIGAIIPGGELLLIITGLIVGTRWLPINILFAIIPVSLAAFIGDLTGYTLGSKWGDNVLQRRNKIFIKKEYLDNTERFMSKYGMLSYFLGHFIPVIRTYIPFLNGLRETKFQTYFIFSGSGCVLYVNVFILLGFGVGRLFPYLKVHLQYIIAAVIVYTFTFPIISLLRHGSGKNNSAEQL